MAETTGSEGRRHEAAPGAGVGPQDPDFPAGRRPEPGKNPFWEILETVLVALAVALLIRTFAVQVYVVDGESMLPNLHNGDRLLVNKFVYRLRPPRPGEIIVFRPDRFPRPFIKRVIAVGGDRVEIRHGVIYVNGRPLPEPYGPTPDPDSFPPVTVPEGTVWVLGDNRPNSTDSRVIGPVPLSRIEGEAFFRFWPLQSWGTLLPPPQPAAANAP